MITLLKRAFITDEKTFNPIAVSFYLMFYRPNSFWLFFFSFMLVLWFFLHIPLYFFREFLWVWFCLYQSICAFSIYIAWCIQVTKEDLSIGAIIANIIVFLFLFGLNILVLFTYYDELF